MYISEVNELKQRLEQAKNDLSYFGFELVDVLGSLQVKNNKTFAIVETFEQLELIIVGMRLLSE